MFKLTFNCQDILGTVILHDNARIYEITYVKNTRERYKVMFQLQSFRWFTLITVISHSTAVPITYAKNNHIKTALCPIHYSNPYTRNDIPTFLKQLFPKLNKAKAGSNYQEAKHSQKNFFFR